MSIEATVEILKAHLLKEGLVLCKNADTQFALDGLKEVAAIRAIVEVVEDSDAVLEWGGDPSLAKTLPVPIEVLAGFARAS